MHADSKHIRDVPGFVGTSLTFGKVDDVLLVCHGQSPLLDDEWQLFLQRVAKRDYRVIMVSTLGAEPDADQRQRLFGRFAIAGVRAPRIGVLTRSSTMRWAHVARRFVVDREAMTFTLSDVAAATRFLDCHAPADRLDLARQRAHYLLEKRVARMGAAAQLDHVLRA